MRCDVHFKMLFGPNGRRLPLLSCRGPPLGAEPPGRWVRLLTRLPELRGSSASWSQPGPEDRELRRSANEFGRSPGRAAAEGRINVMSRPSAPARVDGGAGRHGGHAAGLTRRIWEQVSSPEVRVF